MSPRTELQNQKIKDERREQLLQAASHVFAQKGFAATRIIDIAAEANLSHGLVYHYFSSKEDIFTALMARALQGAIRLTSEALQRSGTPWERLHSLCEQMLLGLRTTPEVTLLTLQTLLSEGVPEEATAHLREQGTSVFTNLITVIRQGQETGEVLASNPVSLALSFFALLQGLTITSVLLKREASMLSPAMLEQFFPGPETILRLLKA